MGRSFAALLDHFGVTDATDVTWSHAANSKAKLDEALTDEKIMMIEADVVMDPVKKVPIMAHPPANSSDLTLEEFLVYTLKHWEKKGMKLDFKQDESLNASVPIMQKVFARSAKFPPIILNADILRGPNTNEKDRKPVNATLFFTKLAPFENAILSPGWTTKFISECLKGYSSADILEMIRLLKEFNVQQDVTFPLRASLLYLNRAPVLQLLTELQPKSSITVWTSSSDSYNLKELCFLRKYPKIILFDLPREEIDIIR